MLARPFASPFAAAAVDPRALRSLAGAYAQVGVQTSVHGASPHRLVAMLFDGYTEAIARGRGAMREGDLEAKGRHIGRAARILEEGLKAGLNMQQGGRLAQDLYALYEYLTLRLTLANLRNDEVILDECVALMEPVQSAWAAIRDQVEPRMAA